MGEAESPDRALDRIEQLARAAFASLVERPEPNAVVVKTTGAPHPVIINVGGTIGPASTPVLTLMIGVALRLDWKPGLSDFLLREHARVPFGRFVRTPEDDLWLTYEILAADCTQGQLAAAIAVLADVSVSTLLVLSRAGILDGPDDGFE